MHQASLSTSVLDDFVCSGRADDNQRLHPSVSKLAAALTRSGRPFCGPSDKTGAVPAVTAPTVPGPGGCTPKPSNRDCNGRPVRRGALVSWFGLRFTVSNVRTGKCYPVQPSAAGHCVDCETVQVIYENPSLF